MIKIENRIKVYGQDCEGKIHTDIVKTKKEANNWFTIYGFKYFDDRKVRFTTIIITGDYDTDYENLLSIMTNPTLCFDELSEAQETFMQTYIYFDGSRLNKYYERFEN